MLTMSDDNINLNLETEGVRMPSFALIAISSTVRLMTRIDHRNGTQVSKYKYIFSYNKN